MQKKAQKAPTRKIELLKTKIVALTIAEGKAIAGGSGTTPAAALQPLQPLQPASYGCTL